MRQGSENAQFSDPNQYKTLVQAAAQAYELSRDALLRTRARTHEEPASAWSTIRRPATREAGVGREPEKSVGRRERRKDMANTKVDSDKEAEGFRERAHALRHYMGTAPRPCPECEAPVVIMAEYGGSDPT